MKNFNYKTYYEQNKDDYKKAVYKYRAKPEVRDTINARRRELYILKKQLKQNEREVKSV